MVAPNRAGMSQAARAVVGLLLVLPAALALLVGYLIPTVRTIIWSFQARSPLGGDAEWIGLDNYDDMVGEGFPGSLLFTLGFTIAPLATLLIVGPLLAAAAHHAGKPGRLLVRLGLTIPMVCFAPVALAIGWLLDRFEFDSMPRLSLWLAAWLTMFGLIVAIGVKVFLAVLRGGAPGRPAWPAGLAVAGLGVLTVLAVTLQTFTYPVTITRGGPARETETLMLDLYFQGFQTFASGPAAARGTVLLVLLMALGIAAWLIVVLSGLRFEVADHPAPTGKPWAVLASVAGLLLVLGITLYGLWPWLHRLGQFGPEEIRSEIGTALVNAWLPPLVSTVIGVGLAAVAGFGIGALRPFGRWSEVLLLPFAPWLFVGIGPLVAVKYEDAVRVLGMDNFLSSIPPTWLVIPALFLFTMLGRGLARSSRGYGSVALRSLPFVALVAAATWLVQAQSLLWGMTFRPGLDTTAPTLALMYINQFVDATPDEVPIGWVLPIPVILVFALGLAALNAFYLDPLTIRAGRERPPAVPAPPPAPPPAPVGQT
ncbi:MAG TPA: sugar ABC transporter permease [Natronosporangium sp.]